MLNFFNENIHIVYLSVILCLLGNHHPSLEFDCGKAVLIIRRLFVYVCACMCIVHLSTCLVIANLYYDSAGGRAVLQHCNEINDPWFFRCDQETKLSSHSETKEVTGRNRKQSAPTPQRLACKCAGSHASAVLSGVSIQTPTNHTHSVHQKCTCLSSPPIPRIHPSQFPPETFCQMLPDSHICAENELYPRAL